jgi:hypothetical protein
MKDDGTIQTSAVFVGVGKTTRVYKSVDDVPPDLRKRLEQTTSGSNSISILIADERGREEIARAIQGLPTPVQSRLAERMIATSEPGRRGFSMRPDWKLCLRLAVIGVAALTIWLAFTWR